MGDTIQYPHGIDGKDIVGAGITAMVARLDAVIKFSSTSDRPLMEMEREKRVYERLGHHDRVVRYYGNMGNNIILQYACHGSIRRYLEIQTKPLALSVQLGWVEQIAEAVAFIHSKNVLHGDISCNNIFVDHSLNIKLGDFAGSAIDEEPPLVCCETSHEHAGITHMGQSPALFDDPIHHYHLAIAAFIWRRIRTAIPVSFSWQAFIPFLCCSIWRGWARHLV
ncbi:serine/threonine protein kinase [Pseudogymnoascus destructans 20631-21]|uniref:EKC/KEOPS complex subunit BUD32 n=1 Tax=Pseudogymnoascus destructans (strain ATCC MYA-4855 / 20631-21) TaxID=658429 RepID=L8G754_PSED2|nr:serine/threonine protein kinase [Pseudogymnoascus destructans 20631-21]